MVLLQMTNSGGARKNHLGLCRTPIDNVTVSLVNSSGLLNERLNEGLNFTVTH